MRKRAFYETTADFTVFERRAIVLVREFFGLPDEYPITRNTRLYEIAGSHEAINFTFWLEVQNT
jgi:hypothetical protein